MSGKTILATITNCILGKRQFAPFATGVLFVVLAIHTDADGVLQTTDENAQSIDHPKIQAKLLPRDDRRLLFIGQDLGSIGGVAGHENGYFESVSERIGGVTTYTSLPSLAGLKAEADWGAGKIHAQKIVDSKPLQKSSLSIGLYLVNELENINAGRHDSKIDELAVWVRTAERPVFLRIGYEFDGYWNEYDPVQYQASFKRIVDRFRANKVKDCAFVWQSGTSPVDDAVEQKHENIADWYPGDDYVDWCGMSWFLDSPKQRELSDELLNFARKRGKPVMICESACQTYDLTKGTRRFFDTMLDGESGKGLQKKTGQQIWDEWFTPFFSYIDKNADVIRAVAYINANWDAQPKWGPPYHEGYWGDSRVQQNPLVLKRWRAEIAKPVWVHQKE